MFAENWEYNSSAQTTLATPLWIPQVFWISGLAFFFICLVFLSIYVIVSMFRRDWQNIEQGLYRLPPDMFPRPGPVLTMSRRFLPKPCK